MDALNPIRWTSGTWEALGVWATFAVAAAAASFAKGQVDEARRTRDDQAQPFPVVEIRRSKATDIMLEIALRNAGATIARNVKIEFTPALESTLDRDLGRVADVKFLAHETPTLTPGMELTTLFDQSAQRYKLRPAATARGEGVLLRRSRPRQGSGDLRPRP